MFLRYSRRPEVAVCVLLGLLVLLAVPAVSAQETTSTETPVDNSTETSIEDNSTETPVDNSTTTSTETPVDNSTTTSTETPADNSTTTSTETPADNSTETTSSRTRTTTSTDSEDPDVSVSVGGDDSTETPAPAPSERGEQIQAGLVLVDKEVRDGTAYLVLRNEESTALSLTLTDAGAVRQGGTVPRKRSVLSPGTSTVSMPTTQVNGLRAVTIGTSQTLYSVVFDDGSSIFQAPQENDRLALGTGVGLVLLSALAVARRKNDLDDNGIRRVDE